MIPLPPYGLDVFNDAACAGRPAVVLRLYLPGGPPAEFTLTRDRAAGLSDALSHIVREADRFLASWRAYMIPDGMPGGSPLDGAGRADAPM